MLLTEDHKQVTIADAETTDQLPRIRLVNLDTLHQPDFETEPSLN